ncbi:hypothetical protein [Herbiconiux daphne]|uniref:Uncharacterized protein n=1 Tax=Herbiconiux daphne TaxID=2970914 RepID=A0ABT2H4Y2_9MICO|nr:hypothetical protein [Herbiconiux daphne]MCS5735002.1 hypothetical protein [Herbiconiux daphne]
MQFDRRLTPDEFWKHVDDTDERLRSTFAPIEAYGLARWPGFSMVTEWDDSGHTRVISFARAMPATIPTASTAPFATTAAPETVGDGVPDAAALDPRDRPPAPPVPDPFDVHVHWRVGESRAVVEQLRRRESALEARNTAWYRPVYPTEHLPDRIVDIKVDGRREPFEVWVRGAVWWAATTLGGRTLAVSARDVPFEDVAFRRVTDVEPYLEGRRAWLRRVRGEA